MRPCACTGEAKQLPAPTPKPNFDPMTGEKLQRRVTSLQFCETLHPNFKARGFRFCPSCGAAINKQ